MKPLNKFLILIEFLACFGPVILILFLGVVMVPFAVEQVFNGHIWGVYLLAMFVGGVLGTSALLLLVIKIIEPESPIISSSKLLTFIVCGIFSLLGFAYMASEGGIGIKGLALILPFVALAHFMYLGRSFLFYKTANKSNQSDAQKARASV